jgi:regulator of protease activity HflC (stomatin/prohibitin superfamily)
VENEGIGRVIISCIVGAILLLLVGVIWFIGSENPKTPAGYVGYLTKGAVFGENKFYGMQAGPRSPGRSWLLDVVNVSITPFTYDEKFELTDKGDTRVIAKDKLAISFEVHIIWRVNRERVKEFVESYTSLHEGKDPNAVTQIAYDSYLKQQIRTFARDEVQIRDGFTVPNEIDQIGKAVMDKTIARFANTPFQIDSVVVGNIQYPKEVSDAISNKLAQKQNLETKSTEVLIAKKSAETRVAEAEGLAKAMQIVQAKLTPQYLQHEAIEAQKAMVNSANHTTIYIPVGPMGVPLIEIPRPPVQNTKGN